MKRDLRADCARATIDVFSQGHYIAPSGKPVDVREALSAAVAGTVLYDLAEMPASENPTTTAESTRLTVTSQTTMEALAELTAQPGGSVGCLNFASAKNPGGFLNGSQAQEESLARSSGLYPCLLAREEYYLRNRAHRSALYLDLALFSPQVPFIRNDDGGLRETPYLASVITCPAPNAGAVAQNEPENAPLLPPTLERRSAFVLTIARRQGIKRLVLGAWGCGVFRNDPQSVAETFARLLAPAGPFDRVFSDVVFAIYDASPDRRVYRSFESVFTATSNAEAR